MLILTFQVDGPAEQVPDIKEALAMVLEKWGDVKLTAIREDAPEQLRMSAFGAAPQRQESGVKLHG